LINKKIKKSIVIEHTPLNVGAHAIRTCWQSFGKSDKGGLQDMKLMKRVAGKLKHLSTVEHIAIIVDVSESEELQYFFERNPFSKRLEMNIFLTNLRVLVENKDVILKESPELLDEDFGFLLRDDDYTNIPSKLNHTANFNIKDKKVTLMHKSKSYNGVRSFTFFIQLVSRGFLQEHARHRPVGISVKSSRYTLKEIRQLDAFIPKWTLFKNALNEFLFNKKPNLSTDIMIKASQYIKMVKNHDVNVKSVYALNGLQQCVKAGIGNDFSKYAMPEAYLTELSWTVDSDTLNHYISLRDSTSAHWEIREIAKELKEYLDD